MDASEAASSVDVGTSASHLPVDQHVFDIPSSRIPFYSVFIHSIESYGWFILIGVIAFYVFRSKYAQYKNKKEVYDPVRVSRLDNEVRLARQIQLDKINEENKIIIQKEKEKQSKLTIERERKKLYDRKLNKNHADRIINAADNDDDDQDNNNDDDAQELGIKKKRGDWIDKMSGASSSRSGFKPYTGGEGGSNIRGARRFGGAPTNCGPTA